MARSTRDVLLVVAIAGTACDGDTPLSPSQLLTASSESAHFTYHYMPGEVMQTDRQEAHYAWATAELGVVLPQKIIYNKYQSRAQMGSATGSYNTNAFAEPEKFIIHTLWGWDSHETVHVYSALFGRPSDFFNEGLAVAFQIAGSFVRFLIDSYGLDRLKAFFRASGAGDSRGVIQQRFEAAFGVSLAAAEAGWLTMLEGV